MKESLKIIFPNSRYDGISIRVEKDKDFAAATKSLLEYFNTGIVDIRRVKVNKNIPMLIDLRLNESVYLVDEIDRSMHPMLSQKLLEYYFSHLSNERDTQLIFSTHESNLLNLDFIRADEVWFVEKGKEGASHLTSLAEYKPREDVRKGYLQGRYGAIPFFAPIKSLKW